MATQTPPQLNLQDIVNKRQNSGWESLTVPEQQYLLFNGIDQNTPPEDIVLILSSLIAHNQELATAAVNISALAVLRENLADYKDQQKQEVQKRLETKKRNEEVLNRIIDTKIKPQNLINTAKDLAQKRAEADKLVATKPEYDPTPKARIVAEQLIEAVALQLGIESELNDQTYDALQTALLLSPPESLLEDTPTSPDPLQYLQNCIDQTVFAIIENNPDLKVNGLDAVVELNNQIKNRVVENIDEEGYKYLAENDVPTEFIFIPQADKLINKENLARVKVDAATQQLDAVFENLQKNETTFLRLEKNVDGQLLRTIKEQTLAINNPEAIKLIKSLEVAPKEITQAIDQLGNTHPTQGAAAVAAVAKKLPQTALSPQTVEHAGKGITHSQINSDNSKLTPIYISQNFKKVAIYRHRLQKLHSTILGKELGPRQVRISPQFVTRSRTLSVITRPRQALGAFRGRVQGSVIRTGGKALEKLGIKTAKSVVGELSKIGIKRGITESLRAALLASGALAPLAPFADLIVGTAEFILKNTVGIAFNAVNGLLKTFGIDLKEFDWKAAAGAGAGVFIAVSSLPVAIASLISFTFMAPVVFAIIVGGFLFMYIPTINIAPILSTMVHLESGLGSQTDLDTAPSRCIDYSPTWDNAKNTQNKARVQAIIDSLYSSYPNFMARVCLGGSLLNIDTMDNVEGEDYYGYAPKNQNGKYLRLYTKAFALSDKSLTYLLVHELGHIVNWRDAEIYNRFNTDVLCQPGQTDCDNQLPGYAYADMQGETEDFAETATWYVQHTTFQDPNFNLPGHSKGYHYTFARDILFGTAPVGPNDTSNIAICEAPGPFGPDYNPPDGVTSITEPSGSRTIQVARGILSDLNSFISDAKSTPHNLLITEGYRTYQRQHELCVAYQSGASPYLAAPSAYGNHRTGRALDMYIKVEQRIQKLPQILIDMAKRNGFNHPLPVADPPHFEHKSVE